MPVPQDSITRIKDAHRTCDLILGVGDGHEKTFRGFEYSASVATVVTDTTLIPVNNTWHPEIENVVYWGMDWLCPAYNLVREPEGGRYSDSRLISLDPTLYTYQVLSEQLRKWHGNITVANTVRDIVSIVQTGNLHAAVYDLTTQVINNNIPSLLSSSWTLSCLTCCSAAPPPLQEMSVSFCKKSTDTSPGPEYSYDRAFTTLQLDTLFAEPAPQ